MDLLIAALLGITQGLTEFLPISSSGHLVLVKALLGDIATTGAMFESVLHAGTALAVIYFFQGEIRKLTRNQIKLIVIGTIPVVIVGFIFQSSIESLFLVENVSMVSIALIVTGVINLLIHFSKGKKTKISTTNAIVIGLSQAVALVPGISRSGITILAGRKQGINAKDAAKFSFILSLPAILGANVLEVYKYGSITDIDSLPFIIGFIGAFLSGVIAIKVVMKLLAVEKFWIFGVYTILLGLIFLV